MRRDIRNDDDRPSLFGDFALDAPASKRAAPQPVSMLSGLASRKSKPRRMPVSRRRWWVGASLLLVSGLVLGVYLQTLSLVAPNTFKPAVMTERAERAVARPPAAQAAAAPAAPAPPTARLETLPPSVPKSALAAPAAATPLDAAQTRVPAPAVQLQSGLKVAARTDPPAPAPAPAAPQGNAVQTQRAAPAAAPAATADSTIARKRTSATEATAGDADVDLLAALMSHPSLTPPASSAHVQRAMAAPAAPAAKPVAAPAAKASGAARATTASTSARPRVDLSIATLVRECNGRADKQEALACRRRICEGYWGKAPACPREQQEPPGQASAAVTPGRN